LTLREGRIMLDRCRTNQAAFSAGGGRMQTIRQILERKGDQVWAVSSTDSVFDAVRRMAELRVGALLVVDAGVLVGIFSERDYARRIILEGRTSRETRVAEIMTPEPVTASLELSADAGLALMTERRFRHLPVLEQGRLVGVVSIGDLVNAVLDDQRELIKQLELYVSS
jgi:CBS domain-containing protein